LEVLAFASDPSHRKKGYGALLSGWLLAVYLCFGLTQSSFLAALKQISKALDLTCIICTYFDNSATEFWQLVGFSKERFTTDEQRIFDKQFVKYPDTIHCKFNVDDYEQEASKQESVDKVVDIIRKLMDVQRSIFKQQLSEMHEIKARSKKRKAGDMSAN
jgi:hypothetical protein